MILYFGVIKASLSFTADAKVQYYSSSLKTFMRERVKGCLSVNFLLIFAVVLLWFVGTGPCQVSCHCGCFTQKKIFTHCHWAKRTFQPFTIIKMCISPFWTRVSWKEKKKTSWFEDDVMTITFFLTRLYVSRCIIFAHKLLLLTQPNENVGLFDRKNTLNWVTKESNQSQSLINKLQHQHQQNSRSTMTATVTEKITNC